MTDFTDDCPDGKCVECWGQEIKAEAVEHDPRDPPVEEGLCLCDACFIDAAEERIADLGDEITELKRTIRKWRRNKLTKR